MIARSFDCVPVLAIARTGAPLGMTLMVYLCLIRNDRSESAFLLYAERYGMLYVDHIYMVVFNKMETIGV